MGPVELFQPIARPLPKTGMSVPSVVPRGRLSLAGRRPSPSVGGVPDGVGRPVKIPSSSSVRIRSSLSFTSSGMANLTPYGDELTISRPVAVDLTDRADRAVVRQPHHKVVRHVGKYQLIAEPLDLLAQLRLQTFFGYYVRRGGRGQTGVSISAAAPAKILVSFVVIGRLLSSSVFRARCWVMTAATRPSRGVPRSG